MNNFSNNSNESSWGGAIIFIFLLIYIVLQENSFKTKMEQREENLWQAWNMTSESVLKMAEENDKILDEIDPDGELELYHYDNFKNSLKDFEWSLEYN